MKMVKAREIPIPSNSIFLFCFLFAAAARIPVPKVLNTINIFYTDLQCLFKRKIFFKP